jgi:hypothetical protein
MIKGYFSFAGISLPPLSACNLLPYTAYWLAFGLAFFWNV